MGLEYERLSPQELQVQEAQLRRAELAEKYHITDQETASLKIRMRDAISALDQKPNIEEVVKVLDGIFTDDVREQELKKLYTDSVIGKVSESIRYFLSPEAQDELTDLISGISKQLEGGQRKFDSVNDVYRELKKYEPVFNKYNLDFFDLAKKFVDELRQHLN